MEIHEKGPLEVLPYWKGKVKPPCSCILQPYLQSYLIDLPALYLLLYNFRLFPLYPDFLLFDKNEDLLHNEDINLLKIYH